MSFNASDMSGEVVPLDPVDFLQFAGIAGVARTVSSTIGKTAVSSFRQLFPSGAVQVQRTLPKTSVIDDIGNNIRKLFERKGVQAATIAGTGATLAATQIRKPLISTGTKAVIGTGLVAVPTSIGLLSLTEGGQNLVTVGGDIGKAAGDIGRTITNTLGNNPLILLGLIGLGALVILKK